MNAKTKFTIAIVLAISLLTLSIASAAPNSPFVGLWRGVDVDYSNLQLSIAGGGPRQIYRLTLMDDNWGYCDGNPGIGRGVGTLDTNYPLTLQTDWLISCPTLHKDGEFHWLAIINIQDDTLTLDYGEPGKAILSPVGN